MRLGVAHHFGWAVTVTASADQRIVDRRRIELVESGVAVAPVHNEGSASPFHQTDEPLDDDALSALVAHVRASARRATSAALDELAGVVAEPIASISLRAWPADFPQDITTQRRPPFESRADSVMYLQILAELAFERDWRVHQYDAKDVEQQAERLLGPRTKEVLYGPRATLGPPWSKDHRIALAATIVAG